MSKTGKRAKKRKAKLKKRLGFLPNPVEGQRFGSHLERQNSHGKACILGSSRTEKQRKRDRQQKQKGWVD